MSGGQDILRKLAAAAHRMPGRRRGLPKPGRRKPDAGGAGEVSPVDPDRPLDLSGGAAAALEFDA